MPRRPAGAIRLLSCAVAVLGVAGSFPARAADPDFDAVGPRWMSLDCDGAAAPPTLDVRAERDLVGDATHPAASVFRDGTYLYFRYRVGGDPRDSVRGFDASDWTMLVQVPSHDGFQYQYQLSLDGGARGSNDTVEVWANTSPEDLGFDPLFTDESEGPPLATQVFDAPGVNTTPLARGVPADSSLRGNPDWFVEVAFPLQMLLGAGVVGSAADLDGALFYPATATAPNRHNKDHLSCRFLPATTLAADERVTPGTVTANATTHVTYTLGVHAGPFGARGVLVAQSALPGYLRNVSITADDPSAVVGQSPLQLRIDRIGPNGTFTVRIDADAAPGCSDSAASTSATASAVNASQSTGQAAVLTVQPGIEVCDGVDNDCDGQVDEGGDALCGDGDACTTDTCRGSSGCAHTPIPGCTGCRMAGECADADPCTADACVAGVCSHAAIPGCRRCTSPAECDDGNLCTDDACDASGVCAHTDNRAPCNDGNACTVNDTCSGGTCVGGPPPDCDDRDPCTQDACAGGTCAHVPIPGCCNPAPEVCDDGRDNDCDGLVDCADPDCAGAAACPGEICGNCIDDDGDGLVDAEDPDCCAAPMTLAVSRLMLRSSGARARGNRLQLQTQYAPTAPPTFDPLKQDTTIELSDAGGALLCTTIAPEHWRRTRRLTFRFTDRRHGFAGGLDSGEFHVNHNGNLLFTAQGRGLDLRAVEGDSVRLTVRVGGACSQSTMALRPARRGLVFP